MARLLTISIFILQKKVFHPGARRKPFLHRDEDETGLVPAWTKNKVTIPVFCAKVNAT
jgi:hypothetical protein